MRFQDRCLSGAHATPHYVLFKRLLLFGSDAVYPFELSNCRVEELVAPSLDTQHAELEVQDSCKVYFPAMARNTVAHRLDRLAPPMASKSTTSNRRI